jgi:hypothetical protein
MDLTEYKSAIESHQQQMASDVEALKRFKKHFYKKLNKLKFILIGL